MASVKLGSLLIRTLAKPIANQIKQQAQNHETFRQICISLAQWMHRTEARMRTGLLGENPKLIKPLSETRAVQNGANNLAEGFLFTVAAGIILAETYRSSRSQAKRRDTIDDSIEELEEKVKSLSQEVARLKTSSEEVWEEERDRREDLARILDRVIYIGLRGGWETLHNGGEQMKMPTSPLLLGLPFSSSSSSTSDEDSSSSVPLKVPLSSVREEDSDSTS